MFSQIHILKINFVTSIVFYCKVSSARASGIVILQKGKTWTSATYHQASRH